MNKRNADRKEYWEAHVSDFRKSGLTQREYCRQHKISYWSFNSWKSRLEKSEDTGQLTEVPRDKIQPCMKAAPFEIVVNDAVKIIIPDNFNPEELGRILTVLRQTQ